MRLTIAVLVTVAVLVAVLAFAAIRTEVTTHHPVSPNRPLLSYGGAPSLDEKIAASAVIARVRFLRAEPVGIHSQTYRAILDQGFHEPLGLGEPLGYVASLEFTFTVLEYLKGTGGTQIKAVAYGAANPRRRRPRDARGPGLGPPEGPGPVGRLGRQVGGPGSPGLPAGVRDGRPLLAGVPESGLPRYLQCIGIRRLLQGVVARCGD